MSPLVHRSLLAVPFVVPLALGASCAPAATLQLDVRSLFNADVVVNDGMGVLDPTQDPIDLGAMASDNFCFATDSAARRLTVLTPDGVPDDALFPADTFHPEVQLAWKNADDGLNARRAAAAVDTFTIAIPPGAYSELHVFMTCGDGTADVLATLAYTDGAATTPLLVPDWFDDPFPTADAYFLIDGRDRVQVGSGPGLPFAYEDRDDAAIFGFRLVTDPARTLTDLRLERTDVTGVLSFFGAVAVEARRGPWLYESLQAPRLLDPANEVATVPGSPFDWTPPAGALLHYFIDDGAGAPALIRVSKSAPGLRFSF